MKKEWARPMMGTRKDRERKNNNTYKRKSKKKEKFHFEHTFCVIDRWHLGSGVQIEALSKDDGKKQEGVE